MMTYAGNMDAVSWVRIARTAREATIAGLEFQSGAFRDSGSQSGGSKDGCESDFDDGELHSGSFGAARAGKRTDWMKVLECE
jgi:hypothetical protein